MNDDEKSNTVQSQRTLSSGPSKRNETEVQLSQIKKERKENLEKLNMIKNRINNIHKQNADCEKRLYILQAQEDRANEIKLSKMQIKKKLEQIKLQKQKTLALKQEKVRTDRLLNEQKLRHAKEQKEIKNKIISDQVKNDKMSIESMLAEYNTHRYNANMVKCVKTKNSLMYANAKKMREKTEIEEEKKRKMQVELERERRNNNYIMRNIKQLEQIEEQCLKKFTETMKLKREKEKSKLNSSMINMTRNEDYKLSLNNNNLDAIKENYYTNKSTITTISAKLVRKHVKSNSVSNSTNISSYKTPNKKKGEKQKEPGTSGVNEQKKYVHKSNSMGKPKKITSYTSKSC